MIAADLTAAEMHAAFVSVSKLINVVLKAFPNASRQEVARQAIAAWTEKRDLLEDQLTKLRARKTKSLTTQASINTKMDALENLATIEDVLDAMMEILAGEKVAHPQKKEEQLKLVA